MGEKLFIIIPIYNVSAYLRECLDSIIAQTYNNFYAILINDGSTDDSGSIAQQYCDKDSRFVLISTINQGVGMARNVGIDYVFTTYGGGSSRDLGYIGFVDSDDVIAKDFYYNLIYALESSSCLVAKSKDIYIFYDEDYSDEIFSHIAKKSKGKIYNTTKRLAYKT